MATISCLLADHVTLRVRSVDRIFLAGYVPGLQCDGQLVRFLLDRVGGNLPSPAILGRIGRGYVEAVDRFALDNEIPVVRFARGACKDDVARPYLHGRAPRSLRRGAHRRRAGDGLAWRGSRDGGNDVRSLFEFSRQSVSVNHYYFYVHDREWGPGVRQDLRVAPYPVRVCVNGHEWAKRQAERAGIGFRALDNGFAVCVTAGAGSDLRRARTPMSRRSSRAGRGAAVTVSRHRRTRYGYRLSIRQLELSDTRVFDRPAAGRAWFGARSQTSSTSAPRQGPDRLRRKVNRRPRAL